MGSDPQEPPGSEESPLSCAKGTRDPRMASVISTGIISCLLHQTQAGPEVVGFEGREGTGSAGGNSSWVGEVAGAPWGEASFLGKGPLGESEEKKYREPQPADQGSLE